MNTLLVKMGAASKKRSLLLLLLLAGLFNVVSATTYYTGTTGSVTLSSGYAVTGTLYSAAANGGTVYTNPTGLTSADVIIVVGAALTTNASIFVQATSGSLTVSGGTATINNTGSAFSGPVTVSGTSTGLTIQATFAASIVGDLTIGTGGTLTLAATSTSAGGSTISVTGNLIMTGGAIAMTGPSTVQFTLNFAGNAAASQAATGTITGTNNSSTIKFNGSSVATATVNSGATLGNASLGTTSVAQKMYTNITNASAPNITLSPWVQLQGNSSLPTSCRIKGNSSTVCELLDLNGYSLSCGYILISSSQNLSIRGGGSASNGNAAAGSNSSITLNGSAGINFASGSYFDNSIPGTTNLVNFVMNQVGGTTLSKSLTLNNNLCINANSTFTQGIIYLNGKTITMSGSPSGGSTTSLIAEGVNATAYAAGATTGGTVIVSNPSTSSINVPIGYSTATAGVGVYTPIAFANTTGSPASFTVAVAPLTTTDVLTSASCIPYEWSITSSTASAVSDITFGATAAATGIASTSQLGVLTTGTSGYANITRNLATASSFTSSTPFTARFNGYTLPANTTANSFVVGTNGSVYPLPTLNSIADQTFSLSSAVNIALTGTNITSLTSSGKPAWLTLSNSSSTAGTISGTSQGTASTSSITINAVNVAGSASRSFTYVEGNFPNINSSSSATALIGGTALSYTVATSSAANLFAITSGSLPSGLSLNTTSGVISGTPSAGTSGSYAVTITATNTGSGLSNSTPFTLTITVLDVPTVTSISPATQAVDFGAFTLTVNGTNFVDNGFSTVTWAGSNLTTTFVSSTQLTAAVPASLVANTASSPTVAVGVTNSGTNASPSTPLTVSSSSNTTNYTITLVTPTVTALSPVASVAGANTSVITVTGTNFLSGLSSITWNGTPIATTYVSATSLTATLSSSLLTVAGTNAVGVTNTGANITHASAATQTFTVYSAGAAWAFNASSTMTLTAASSSTTTVTCASTVGLPTGSVVTVSSGTGAFAASTTVTSITDATHFVVSSTPTTALSGATILVTGTGAPISASNVTGGTLSNTSGSTSILPINTSNANAIFNTTTSGATGMRYTPSLSGTVTTWPADAVTINSNFVGINSDAASRYIQFDAAANAGYNFTVRNITIPFTNSTTTQGTSFRVAYSLNNFSTFTDIVGSSGFIPTGSTYIFSYTTPIIVPAGSTISVRVIPIGKSTFMSGASITLANVVIAGTSTASYPSPVITSATGTVSGDAAVTYTAGSPIYTLAATTTQGSVTYSASGLTGTGYSLDASTGKITGTYVSTSGGAFNATLTADNGNLFPTSTTLAFDIAGIPVTPSVTSISPATSKVDTTAFTLTVNGTDFINGKSAITWNGTPLTTTYISTTQLTAAVPASLVAGNVITDNTVAIGVYNTGAAVPASTVNQTYTITNVTPSIAALSPAGVVAGNADFTLTVYGSNFTTGSKITFNGTQLTTTFVNGFQLTATVAAANVVTAGTKNIGVINVFPNGASLSTATTNSFIVGNAIATWTAASLTPNTSGSIIATTPTLTNYTTSTNGNGVTYNEVFPGSVADGSTSTADPTFAGLTTAPGLALVAAKSIDFKVTPADNTDINISAITIPVLANGNGMEGVIGYSTDGTNFTKISTATNTSSATSASTIVNTNDFGLGNGNLSVTNYVFPTPILITNGNTLTIRVIPWRKSSSATVVPVNIGPLSVIFNTTPQAFPDAPSISSLADGSAAVDVSFSAPVYTGTTAITSYKVYAYANGSGTAATSASANVSSLTLPYHINVTGLTNGTSYTFKVSATNGSGEGYLSANSSAVIPSNSTTWTVTNGVGSWDHGDPDLGDQNATINGNYTLTKALNCLKLTVATNVTVALGNFNFTVQGNLVNNGTISGNGTLLLNTTSAQTITGSGTVGNVTINNTSGGVSVTAGNMFNVSGVLTLQSGALTTNSRVTFKSTSIANTGTLAAYGTSGNTGTISGTVIVERYIPAGFRGYRDLAPQVNNAGSIFNNWQEGGAFTSGKGIFITGPSATDANAANYSSQPAPNSVGLDYSINGVASAFTYTNSNGTFYSLYAAGKVDSIYNTKTINLEPFTGYRVLVRGDRSFNLATTPIVNYYNIGLRMVNSTVLRSTGNVITGTVTYATSGVTNTSVGSTYQASAYGLNGTVGKFSMIANPYIAPIQWGTGTGTNSSTTTVYGASSNINGSYYYYDTKFGSTGTYAAYNALTGSVYAGNTTSGYIQPGQAFFVQTSASSPTVVIKETAKATSVAKVAVFGAAAPLSKIYISLLKQDASNTYNNVDAAAIAFHESFTNATYGPQDAIKFGNNNDNLSISDKGKALSIDGRLPATATDKIPVNIGNISGTAYQLDIDATTYSANGFAPYLVDSYKGTTATLTSGLNSFKFTVDAKVAGSFENRFSIAFKPTTLAVNSIVATAKLNNKIATISWNTVGEKGVSRFEVEKSTDAKNFVKIGQASAKNTSTATYTTTDNNTTAATNYYRIKAISEVGTVSYSNVAQLTVNSKQFSVYPNPLVGKALTVSFGNVAAGKYTVTINNVLGQRVQEVAISHAGGSASHAITVNKTLAAGTYSVTIRETASGLLVNQTNLSVQP